MRFARASVSCAHASSDLTHEELITDIARRELKSYRQLPVNFYQIQLKFRDEVRPRFGVMRAREFRSDARRADYGHRAPRAQELPPAPGQLLSDSAQIPR